MYTLRTTHQFDQDLKKCFKRGLPVEDLRKAINILITDGKLPAEYRPTNSTELTAANGSATFSLIGFLYGNRMTLSLLC